jgi:hypothetical protein
VHDVIPTFKAGTKYPEIVYPKYNTAKRFNLTATREGDKFCMSTKQFKAVTEKMIDMKYQIVLLQSILDDYNKWAVRQNAKKR